VVVLAGGYSTLCVVWFSYLDRWAGPGVALPVPVCVTLLIVGFLGTRAVVSLRPGGSARRRTAR
jgi:hypothetical protein